MIHIIRLDCIATPHRDLVTRSTGAIVRAGIERAIAEARCRAALLDFSAVGLIDFSCADEIVAKLLRAAGPAAEWYLLLGGLKEDHLEAIDQVLGRQGLAVAAVERHGAPPRLLGHTNPDLCAAFERVHSLGPGDALLLALALDWTLDRAADALQALALLRLVHAREGRYEPVWVV